jgi:hypothetical protein
MDRDHQRADVINDQVAEEADQIVQSHVALTVRPVTPEGV